MERAHNLRVVDARTLAAGFDPRDRDQRFFGDGSTLRLRNVVVSRRYSLICTQDFHVIPEANYEQILWIPSFLAPSRYNQPLAEEAERRLHFLQQEADAIDRTRIADLSSMEDEVVYFMHPFEWYPYGHFYDAIQRLFPLISESGEQRALLTCRRTQAVTDFAAHLAMHGYHSHQTIGFPAHCEAIRIKHLIVTESPSCCGQFTHETMAWLRKTYLENPHVLAYKERHESIYPQGRYILFLDRGAAGSRDILNKQELLHALARLGLPIRIFTGTEPLLETLLAFSHARVIVGAHGAMFMNTIFCDPQATIIELAPNTRIYRSMVRMCKPCLNHSLVILPALDDHSILVDAQQIVAFTAQQMVAA